GVAEAVSRADKQEYSLAIMSKGQIFGEVAFISKTVRSADVNALTEMKVLVISKGFLMRAMRKQPEISAKVLLNLSLILAQRLRDRTDSWVDAMNR
ncbi:MAG: cyclic nucleotide-binding domain-containing protein, partial [Pirellulales bacterium]|nr:cyclic nucleotide-binding domain-containing protein [Pirellulales bacterium]